MKSWLLLTLLLLPLTACFGQTGLDDNPQPIAASVAQAAPLPTLAQIAVLPSATTAVTLTPIPTSTPSPTASATPTSTPSPTATATPPPISRTCPESIPAKPDYERFVLGESVWATPLDNPQPHFWLEKPLPGGGRYLYNTSFPYGYDQDGNYLLHNGLDTGAALGTPVLAVANGTVVVAGRDDETLYGWRCDWYGHLVVIELEQAWLGQPVYALYGHVLNIGVAVGQKVSAGEQVAEVGYGGAAIVPHLHFEVRVGQNAFGQTRNPLLWVQPPETRGVIAGRVVDGDGRPWHGVWISAIDSEGYEWMTWSYLEDPLGIVTVQPDLGYAENFVFSDLPAGTYELVTKIGEETVTAEVEVIGGQISTAELIIP
ncbi:MAG: peptidoglycan DD-metalloendopeptidase family protein [Chloroflexi bacterium]|nr:peptidoglycan DD-metalloendopeptidase family protein [Chloroflexota bacterium]